MLDVDAKPLSKRDLNEELLGRAKWLDPKDRALVTQVVERDVPARDAARLMGRSTRSIQRRVAHLIKRLTDPEVVIVLRERRRWPRPLGHIALDIWVRGRTLRDTCRRHDMTLHELRMAVQQIRGRVRQHLTDTRQLDARRRVEGRLRREGRALERA